MPVTDLVSSIINFDSNYGRIFDFLFEDPSGISRILTLERNSYAFSAEHNIFEAP